MQIPSPIHRLTAAALMSLFIAVSCASGWKDLVAAEEQTAETSIEKLVEGDETAEGADEFAVGCPSPVLPAVTVAYEHYGPAGDLRPEPPPTSAFPRGPPIA